MSHEPETGGEPQKSRFSALHTRTHEAELLVSGAVVFGLFHVAPIVSVFFTGLESRLEGMQRMAAIYGQLYLSLVIYALIGTFLLHLAMRAFWIGLVGLESVYPNGIRWDTLKAGPYFIRHSKKRAGTLAGTIESLDDVCSLIFSFGFLIVVNFLYSVVIMAVCAGLALLFSGLFFDGRFFVHLFWIGIGLLLGLQLAGNLVDRSIGKKLEPESVAGRVVSALVVSTWYLSPLRWIGQIQLTLQSNTSNTKVVLGMSVVMISLMVGFLGVVFVEEGVIRLDSLVYFPDDLHEQGIDPLHYRDLRGSRKDIRSMPSIQSDMVEDPYLVLSIPYYPRRHNPFVREKCPDLQPFRPSGFVFGEVDPPDQATFDATIGCLASLFEIELDANSLTELEFDYTRDPGIGRASIVTYIPIADLEPGRHELIVVAPSHEMSRGDTDAKPDRHRIPFWR
jgi:hypothetical protein